MDTADFSETRDFWRLNEPPGGPDAVDLLSMETRRRRRCEAVFVGLREPRLDDIAGGRSWQGVLRRRQGWAPIGGIAFGNREILVLFAVRLCPCLVRFRASRELFVRLPVLVKPSVIDSG